MKRISFTRHVPFAPERMLELVADVERYPEFVPNCTRMDVDRDPVAPESRYDARMHIRFGPINQAYTSHVAVDREEMTIKATAEDGPFAHLVSRWTFHAEGQGARIEFEVVFRFRNPLLAATAEGAFAAKQGEIVDAFVARAREIYA